jgi:NAD(P)-dependent dehydrogenase (short-subunit alcohol dehydrogenase family)
MRDVLTQETGAIVVTGAARGIGRGTAEHLLERGGYVAAIDIDLEVLESWGNDNLHGHRLLSIEADVSSEDAVHAAVDAAVARFGSISGLVNNAAIADPYIGEIEVLDVRKWQRVLDVNLTGPLLCAKACIPHLRKTRGAIVNVASTRALMSEPNSEAYAASKGGLVALTHALSLSVGPDVRVNCISPGWIDTTGGDLRPIDHSQHPVGRVGRPHDIAALAAFLLSDDAGFITGQNFVVDGGMTRKMIYAD